MRIMQCWDDGDVDDIRLVECKRYIEKHFGQKDCGMAYPCGAYDDAVKTLVRKAGYLYSRTTKYVDLHLNIDDPMALHTHCHFLAADFWQKFEAVKAMDGDFYFWGHT